jgi:modulator of FtsH protease HflK
MPWNDQSGGQGSGPNSNGPWGSGPRRPWGQQPPPRSPQGQGPDLEEMMRQWRERFRMGGGGGGGQRSGAGGGGISWRLVGGVLAIGWVASGIYTVNETQLAVITRLGDYARTTTPGIHWHLPPPLEARQIVDVTSQRTDEIGCVTRGRECVDVSEESLMITGDRNIVEVHFRISYNVSDVEDFVFKVRDVVGDRDEPGAVRQVAESAMREVIGRRQLEPIITTDRAAVEQDVAQLTQQVLNEYQAGVQVIRVELLSASAPPAVIEAFNDVVNAGQDAEAAVNNANRETAQIVNAAEAYKEQVVREAAGEAQRFVSVYTEYRQAPQVTRDRLYIETMERVYRSSNLVILDQRGGAVPYLPLENFVRRPAAQTPPAPQPVQPQGGR